MGLIELCVEDADCFISDGWYLDFHTSIFREVKWWWTSRWDKMNQSLLKNEQSIRIRIVLVLMLSLILCFISYTANMNRFTLFGKLQSGIFCQVSFQTMAQLADTNSPLRLFSRHSALWSLSKRSMSSSTSPNILCLFYSFFYVLFHLTGLFQSYIFHFHKPGQALLSPALA